MTELSVTDHGAALPDGPRDTMVLLRDDERSTLLEQFASRSTVYGPAVLHVAGSALATLYTDKAATQMNCHDNSVVS